MPRQTAEQNIKAFLEALMPALLSFGSLSVVIGLRDTREIYNGLYLVENVYAATGALALSLGLLFLWTRQTVIKRCLDELEKARA